MDLRFFEIYRRSEHLLLLLEGAFFSVALTVAAATFGFLIALALSGVRFEQIRILRNIAAAYVEFIRNTPLIVQLFFVAVLGEPEGVVLYQLIFATLFTIYLSLIAFLGGGLVGALITVLRISPSKPARFLVQAYIWFFQSAPLLMLLFLFGLGVPRLLGVNVNIWKRAW